MDGEAEVVEEEAEVVEEEAEAVEEEAEVVEEEAEAVEEDAAALSKPRPNRSSRFSTPVNWQVFAMQPRASSLLAALFNPVWLFPVLSRNLWPFRSILDVVNRFNTVAHRSQVVALVKFSQCCIFPALRSSVSPTKSLALEVRAHRYSPSLLSQR